MTPHRVLIVGGSLAGVRTAQELRRLGYDGDLVIVGEEEVAPYDRPPLSKQVLTGQRSPASLALAMDEDYAEAGIRLLLGVRATQVDQERKVVRTNAGDDLPYDALVVATGVRARTLPGTGLPGVHVLRTLADSLAVAESIRSCSQLVIVGAGFVGAEVAAVARGFGVATTLVEATLTPLARAIGPEMGSAVTDLHRDKGVVVRCNAMFSGTVGNAHVEGVRLEDGTVLPADAVLIGVGTRPNTEWLATSGLDVADGVACHHGGLAHRSTDVFAAGDVARWYDPTTGAATRVEHWTNAVEQARVVAASVLAAGQPPARPAAVPYFWSDQYGVKIQFVGRQTEHVEIVRGSLSEQKFLAMYYDSDKQLVGGLAFDQPRLIGLVRRWISVPMTRTAALESLAAVS